MSNPKSRPVGRSRDERVHAARADHPGGQPDHVEAAEEAAVLHLDAAVLHHLQARRRARGPPTPARRCRAASRPPSRRARSPRRRSAGTSSGRRKMFTISSGPAAAASSSDATHGSPEHLVAGRVDRRDLVAVGRPCGPSPGSSGGRGAATAPPPPGGGSDRGCGARRPRARRGLIPAYWATGQVCRGDRVHKSFTTGSRESHPCRARPGLRSPPVPRDPPRAGPALHREEHHADGTWTPTRRGDRRDGIGSWNARGGRLRRRRRLGLRAPPAAGSDLSGNITIDGSSTVGPLTSAAAEAFNGENSDVNITVGTSGTGGGFELFCNGETDISRRLRPDQRRADRRLRGGRRHVRGAARGLGRHHARHRQRPSNVGGDGNLTLKQLEAIWAPDSKINNWKDIPGRQLRRRAAHAGGRRLAVGHLRLLQREGPGRGRRG